MLTGWLKSSGQWPMAWGRGAAPGSLCTPPGGFFPGLAAEGGAEGTPFPGLGLPPVKHMLSDGFPGPVVLEWEVGLEAWGLLSRWELGVALLSGVLKPLPPTPTEGLALGCSSACHRMPTCPASQPVPPSISSHWSGRSRCRSPEPGCPGPRWVSREARQELRVCAPRRLYSARWVDKEMKWVGFLQVSVP